MMKRSEHEKDFDNGLALLVCALIITIVSLIGMGVIAYFGNMYQW